VTSKARRSFWAAFATLPQEVQRTARQKFELWRSDPFHPSLHFKELRSGVWSVRVNQQYRALAMRDGDLIAWFWIGPHSEYNRLV
jgi:plasmid maintenance system killer protein